MAAFNKFQPFVNNLAEGALDFDTDTINLMLVNAAPPPTAGVYGDISATEIAAGAGYLTGGLATTRISSGQVSGKFTLVLAPVVLNATGNVATFRYAVLYSLNTTVVAKPLIGWWDNGSPVSLQLGGSFTVAFDPTLGAISIQ